jgi:hypothetical protein
MTDRFDPAHWKVDLAQRHADDLDAEIRAFWVSEPYEVATVVNPLSGSRSYRIKRTVPLPAVIPLIAGDAAHNIRSALDHFAWAADAPPERSVRTCYRSATARQNGRPTSKKNR